MNNLKAYAVRKDGAIQVSLLGNLPNSCHAASVRDKYPGGGIVYVTDPGTAQIFVEETARPEAQVCLMMLVPWVAHVTIPDATHSQVTVFVNNSIALKVEVKGEAAEYRVIALTGAPDGNTTGCSIIPADAPYLAIYSSVYGPATKSSCESWRTSNCAPHG